MSRYAEESGKEQPAAFRDATSRPLEPTQEERERWAGLPDRRTDSSYMRYLQSRRSAESLAESGRAGFRATSDKYGHDAAMEYSARFWREHPERASGPERDMMDLLRRLGQEPRLERGGRGDYERIYKGAPGVWVDFAYPDQQKAIEVWGGVHSSEFLERVSPAEAAEKRVRDEKRLEMLQERGWAVKVVMAHELRGERAAETERHIRNFLDPNPAREVFIPGVFEPQERSEEAQRYRAERPVEDMLADRDQLPGWDYARAYHIVKDERPVGFAWLDTKRAVELYADEREADADAPRRRAFAERGWDTLVLTRDRDLLPERRDLTADALVRWGRRGDPSRPFDRKAHGEELDAARREGRERPATPMDPLPGEPASGYDSE